MRGKQWFSPKCNTHSHQQPFLLLFHCVKFYRSLACCIISTPNCSAVENFYLHFYLVWKCFGFHLVKAVDVTQTEISSAWTRLSPISSLFAQGNLYNLRKGFPFTVGIIILGRIATTKLKSSSLDRPSLQRQEAILGNKLQKGPSLHKGMLCLVTASPHYWTLVVFWFCLLCVVTVWTFTLCVLE